MESHALKQFSEELRAKRESSGISLEQIVTKTRLDLKFLEAIEEGNFGVMPEVYMRAFIREYAQAIDIDADAALKKYDLAKEGKLKEEQKIILEKKTPEKIENIIENEPDIMPDEQSQSETSKSAKRNNLYYIIGAVLIFILIIIYFVFFTGSGSNIVTEQPYDELISSQQARYEIPEEKRENTAFPGDSLSLKLLTSDTSWIKFFLDSKEPREMIMMPNRSKVLKAQSAFELIIGNSAGVKLQLNDSELDFSGKKGEVKRIRITSAGIQNLETDSSNKQ